MSLALQQVDPILVKQAALDLAQPVYYGVYDSAQNLNYQVINANSDSSSVSTYSANPPSPYIAIDRRAFIRGTFEIVFANTGAANAQLILQEGYDALRAYPMSQCMSNMKITINNSEFSLQVSEVLNEMLRYQYHDDDDCSMTPNILDESQQYNDLANDNRNPLAGYGNKFGYPSRGGFVYDDLVIANDSATLTVTVTEPIFVSPFVSHYPGAKALYGVQNLSASVVWQNLSRMWSHNASSPSNITSINVTNKGTALLFRYLTPQPLKKIPKSLQYNYHTIEPHITQNNAAVPASGELTITSNNIQFNSVPNKVYIYVKERLNDRTYTDTDSWFSIENVNITFSSVTGQIGNASKQQLYFMNKDNGSNQSWVAWSGETTRTILGAGVIAKNGPAGPLCLRFGKEIGLPASSLSPGVSGIFQFSVTVKCTNRSDHAITPSLYVSEMYEGLVTITENTALQQLAVLSQNDVLDVMDPATGESVPSVSDSHSELVMGGSFWSDFTSGVSKAVPVIRKIRGAVQKYAPLVSDAASAFGPYGQAVGRAADVARRGADAAQALGLGIDEEGGMRRRKGGVLIGGGARLSRSDLHNRLRNL